MHTYTFPSVHPRCLFSLIAFEICCIGRVLLVLGSRLKNEVEFDWVRLIFCSVLFANAISSINTAIVSRPVRAVQIVWVVD